MTQIPVSVIVVSRHRPDALIRCLTGISQLRYAPFEVVVVADAAAVAALRRWPLSANVKAIVFDEANISAARNIGIKAAAGEVVAFIDDDAVPEPGWLAHLARVFYNRSVDAAGGYVLGRNGISWQWTAQSVDTSGVTQPLRIPGNKPVVLSPPAGRAIKTEGTNMAFRRSVIAGLGGFDPSFQYFLDETDVNMRLAGLGASTAIVPRAVVHHGYAANQTRRADRVPRDLTQLGASWAVFLSRHCPEEKRAPRWRDVVASERVRALRYMVQGLIEPRDVRRLLASLRDGYVQGSERAEELQQPLGSSENTFAVFPSEPQRQIVASAGSFMSRNRLRAEAIEDARAGRIPVIYTFSRTALYHRRLYHAEGYWEQRGGLYGRSLRSDPVVRFWRFPVRVRRETAMWAGFR